MMTTNATNPALYTPSSSNMRLVNGNRVIEVTNVQQITDFQQFFPETCKDQQQKHKGVCHNEVDPKSWTKKLLR